MVVYVHVLSVIFIEPGRELGPGCSFPGFIHQYIVSFGGVWVILNQMQFIGQRVGQKYIGY